MTPRADDFRAKLAALLQQAESEGKSYLDVVSRDLHREVGGYPRPNRMPVCCSVMNQMQKLGDEVLDSPPSGFGATLKIRYWLPR